LHNQVSRLAQFADSHEKHTVHASCRANSHNVTFSRLAVKIGAILGIQYDIAHNTPNLGLRHYAPCGTHVSDTTSPSVGNGEVRKTTIRFQILLALNSLLGIFVVSFLVVDYRRELSERFEEKHIALEEEAKTLLPAAVRLSSDGEQAVQTYVDEVCHHMRDVQSPGHHIAIRLGESTLQATAHNRESDDMLNAMTVAAESSNYYLNKDGFEIVVGKHEQGELAVYISEDVAELRSSVFRDELRRFTGLLFFAVLAALLVNLVLLRIVARPLDRLVSTVRTIGRGDFKVEAGAFRSAEFSFLAGEIDAMSASLASAEQARAIEMAKARQIQQNLLPSDNNVPGVNLSHIYEPATDVAGDYFDILDMGPNGWLFCIADVTGHGVPAAMSAAMLKTLLAQAIKVSSRPSTILEFINDNFVDVTLDEDFATMLLVRVDLNDMCLEFSSAGHESGWLLAPTGEMRELSSTGIMLGVNEGMKWKNTTLTIHAGERLFSYTDGLPETFNAEGQYLGRDVLPDLFRKTCNQSVAEACDQLRRVSDEHRNGVPYQDDLTFLVAEFAKEAQQNL